MVRSFVLVVIVKLSASYSLYRFVLSVFSHRFNLEANSTLTMRSFALSADVVSVVFHLVEGLEFAIVLFKCPFDFYDLPKSP